MTTVRPGIHRHYKKHLYEVLFLAHDANEDTLWVSGVTTRVDRPAGPSFTTPLEPVGERDVVVYIGIQTDASVATGRPRVSVRSVEDFTATICGETACPRYGLTPGPDDQCGEHDQRPRFEYLGPVLTEEMIR